jgi:hypothetical protein
MSFLEEAMQARTGIPICALYLSRQSGGGLRIVHGTPPALDDVGEFDAAP